MQIRLDQIADEPFRWEEEESIDPASLDRSDLLGLSEVAWTGSVERAHPGYRLLASIRYSQTLACGRCLKPCHSEVSTNLELVVMVKPPALVAGEVQLEASDLGLLELDSETLDTDPVLLEQLELNVPMSQLCQPDCLGLCPHCGADRNEVAQCCGGGEVDPRWQALKDLKLD